MILLLDTNDLSGYYKPAQRAGGGLPTVCREYSYVSWALVCLVILPNYL